MAAIRSKGTKPELAIRPPLPAMGYHYRPHVAGLPGPRRHRLRDVAPTRTRGGQGTSVNSAPSVVIIQNLRRAGIGTHARRRHAHRHFSV